MQCKSCIRFNIILDAAYKIDYVYYVFCKSICERIIIKFIIE